MTRRDTIIVAVLINAGLLVVLFISSLKSDTKQVAAKQEMNSYQAHAVKKEVPIAKAPSDQVDQILAQYSKKLAKEPVKEEKKPVSPTKEAVEPSVKEDKKTAEKSVALATAKPSEIPEAKLSEGKASEKEKLPSSHERAHEQVKIVVKKGDVLEKIAKTYGTTVGAIMQENRLTDSRLQIGQVLYVSQNTKAASPIKAIPVDEERYYIVKNGDNLWKIAIDHHLKVDDLLKLNQLSEKEAKGLRPGARLRIK